MLHGTDHVHSHFEQGVLSGPLKELFSKDCSRLSLQKGRKLYREGSPTRFIYHVLEGAVKTYQTNKSGQTAMNEVHKADSFFGYTTLFNNKLYAASAVCIEDTELIKIPDRNFISLLHTSPQFASYFIGNLTQNLEEQIDFLLQQTFLSLKKKLAEGLLYLYKKQEIIQRSEPIYLSREDINFLIGNNTQSLISILSEFQEEGIIQLHETYILILDIEKLERKYHDFYRSVR